MARDAAAPGPVGHDSAADPAGPAAAGSSTGTGGLARRQREFVAAVVAAGPAPAGVDPRWIDLTRRTLAGKRFAAVRRHFPILGAALDSRLPPREPVRLFVEWAAEHATAGGLPLGGYRDGLTFAVWLDRRGLFPREAVAEIGRPLLGWRPVTGGVPQRRRWWGLTVIRLAGARVVAVGTPARVRQVRVWGA